MKNRYSVFRNLTISLMIISIAVCCQFAMAEGSSPSDRVFVIKNESHYFLQPVTDFINSENVSMREVTQNGTGVLSAFAGTPPRIPPHSDGSQIIVDSLPSISLSSSFGDYYEAVDIWYSVGGNDKAWSFTHYYIGNDILPQTNHPDEHDDVSYRDVNPCKLHFEYDNKSITLKSANIDDTAGYGYQRQLIRCEKADDHTIRIMDAAAS